MFKKLINIKTQFSLRSEIRQKNSEISRMKQERKELFDKNEKDKITTEDEFQNRLEYEKREIIKPYEKKIEKLLQKIDILKHDFQKEKLDFSNRFQKLNNLIIKVEEMIINISPLVDRMEIFHTTEIKNSNMIKKEASNLIDDFKKFKNQLIKDGIDEIEYIETDAVVEDEK